MAEGIKTNTVTNVSGVHVLGQNQPRKLECSHPGCHDKARCIPVLVVPCHPMARVQHAGVRSVLWLPLCFKHNKVPDVRTFLSGDVVANIEASITKEFNDAGSMPDFKRAVVGHIFDNEPEFAAWREQYEASLS